MEEIDIQQHFFNHLKSILPKHLSLVDAMADLLDLSHDSVYRRIRGEKPLTLGELKILCEQFHISLDQVIQIQNNTVVFYAPEIGRDEYDFGAYLKGMIAQLNHFNSFDQKQLIYLAKDLPLFHFFHYRELAAFKFFFWLRSIINHPDYQEVNFSLKKYSFDEYFQLAQQVVKTYNEIPSIEVWNHETINSMISQIDYYRDADIFESKEDLLQVIDALDRTLVHLQHQVEKGQKFPINAGEAGYRSPLKFYINELILGNNSGLVELDGKRSCFVNHGVIHYLMTTDERFNKRAFDNLNALINRSTMISQTGEKERNKFFRLLKDCVKECRQRSA